MWALMSGMLPATRKYVRQPIDDKGWLTNSVLQQLLGFCSCLLPGNVEAICTAA